MAKKGCGPADAKRRVIRGRRATHPVVVAEERSPALFVLMQHLDTRVVHGVKATAGEAGARRERPLRASDRESARLAPRWPDTRHCSRRETSCPAAGGRRLESDRGTRGSRERNRSRSRVADADRAAHSIDCRIAEMLLEPVDPIRGNDAVLIREEDQPSASQGDTAVSSPRRPRAVARSARESARGSVDGLRLESRPSSCRPR